MAALLVLIFFFLTNLLLPLHIPFPTVFPPLWSLAVEEQFYLVWPFAVYFLSERRLRNLSIFIIALAPLLRGLIHFSSQWPIYMLTPFRMDLLAAGALVCLIWRRKPLWISKYGTAIAVLLVVLAFIGFIQLGSHGIAVYENTRLSNVTVYEVSLIQCLGLLLYALAGHGVGWLCFKPLRYIGKISYTMYLVHFGIITLLESHLHGLALAGIALFITVAYSSLSWHLMESRLLHHTRTSLESQPAVRASRPEVE